MSVTLTSDQPLSDGLITITGVTASNAAGQLVVAAPNSLPLSGFAIPSHVSAPVGQAVEVVAEVVDLDGSVQSVAFAVDGVSAGTSSASPPTIIYTSLSSGSFAMTATATDNSGQSDTFLIGTLRAYTPGEIARFSDFLDIHYGANASPASRNVGADPFEIGVANGVAYLLGINPHAPERSRLPSGSVESGLAGDEAVFRFTRIPLTSGISWSVHDSGNLSAWEEVPGSSIVESPGESGFIQVEVRRPFPEPPSPPHTFIGLHVSLTP